MADKQISKKAYEHTGRLMSRQKVSKQNVDRIQTDRQ